MKVKEHHYWGIVGFVLVVAGMSLIPWVLRPGTNYLFEDPVAVIWGFIISTAAMPLLGLSTILSDLARGQLRPKFYAIVGGLSSLLGLAIWVLGVRKLSGSPFDLMLSSFAALVLVGSTTFFLIARTEKLLATFSKSEPTTAEGSATNA